MPQVACDLCGKVVHRTPGAIKNAEHHFCCKEHCIKYRKRHGFNTSPEKNYYRKLIELRNLKRNLY